MSAAESDAVPSGVVTASWLYIVSAALSVLNAAVTLVLLPTIIAASVARATEQVRGQNTGDVDVAGIARGAAIAGVTIGTVLTVVVAVLTVLFARRMLRGKNWARIVLAVFAGLHLFGVVGIGGSGIAVTVLTTVEIIVIVLAAVLTFTPVANLWFRSMRPVRAPF